MVTGLGLIPDNRPHGTHQRSELLQDEDRQQEARVALEPECKAGRTVASGRLVRGRMGEDCRGQCPGLVSSCALWSGGERGSDDGGGRVRLAESLGAQMGLQGERSIKAQLPL